MKSVLYIVGMGPGEIKDISMESLSVLKSVERVLLRTAQHPGVGELDNHGVVYDSCDSFYEQGVDFEDVYAHIAEFCLNEAGKYKSMAYVVPGSPLVAEKTVQIILQKQVDFADITLKILPAMSFLDAVYAKIKIDPCDGLRIVDALNMEDFTLHEPVQLIITQIYNSYVASDVKLKLMEFCPDETTITFMRNLGCQDETVLEIPLYELDRQADINHLTTVYIPAIAERMVADLGELEETMQKLRSPGGCMWDIEQNHSSIRQNFIEEVYEVIEAIDLQDSELLCEELGDVLLQIVFHAQIAREDGSFDLQRVIDGINSKLIRRHPHVFGEISVANSAEIVYNWEQIKKSEKKGRELQLDGIPKGLPSLLTAYKLQSRAAKVGFDWDGMEPIISKIHEELQEVLEATSELEREKEIGDLLFAVVNLSRYFGVAPELALNISNRSFKNRFNYVEQCVRSSTKDWRDFSLTELDVFGEEAKSKE